MPIRLRSASDFWARIFGDSATAGDGTTDTAPARYDGYNSDIGSVGQTPATADSGNFTLLQYEQRLLIKLTNGIITVSRTPGRVASDQLVRPADTTAYAAGDTVSNSTTSPVARTFANAALVNGGGGRIERATCLTSNQTMAGALRLHLYRSATIPAVTADNAPFTITQGVDYLGWVDFSGFQRGIAEGFPASAGAMPFTTHTSTTSLFGRVEALTAFTPTSGQTFDFVLWVDQV